MEIRKGVKTVTTDKKQRDLERKHRDLLIHIPRGSDNAVSMRDLANALGTDTRQVRHLIERARIDGVIIAGTNAGIFIPENEFELKEYVNRTVSRIRTSRATVLPALKKLEVMEK